MYRRDLLKLASLALAPLTLPAFPGAVTAQAPGFPSPKFIETNGIRLAVYEKGRGMPVIFCHGFPELAYSWRHQLDSVAAAGFRAIAPDLRGFGLSDKPQGIGAYAATEICDDLIGMMDSMGLEQAVFCGHDWGQFIADTMLLLYPERCAGLVDIGGPHNYRPDELPAPHWQGEALADKAAYNAFMQRPEVPEKLLNSHVRGFFATFFRRDYFTSDNLRQLPATSPERRLDLPSMLRRSNSKDPLFVSAKDLGVYVSTYEKTGFDGGINWYRAMNRTWEELNKRKLHWGVDVPYLYLWPAQDPINTFGLKLGLEDYIANLEMHALSGSGHFALEASPEAVSGYLVQWLHNNFTEKAS
ncbi:alpha/beta fold hydrolase [Microbulbifer hainanensis]|uniref:alpha/beta fold hydrolase n=1 Tax=Microbulbifer hainanensis TaxID=2735675 RepID=UPI0018692BD3|nr:alpha/beta hydrolase [Microbulbifer hainanensis]